MDLGTVREFRREKEMSEKSTGNHHHINYIPFIAIQEEDQSRFIILQIQSVRGTRQ